MSICYILYIISKISASAYFDTYVFDSDVDFCWCSAEADMDVAGSIIDIMLSCCGGLAQVIG